MELAATKILLQLLQRNHTHNEFGGSQRAKKHARPCSADREKYGEINEFN
jgi:hypothetical protein